MKCRVMADGRGLDKGMRIMVHWDDPPGWYTGVVVDARLSKTGAREYRVVYDNSNGEHDKNDHVPLAAPEGSLGLNTCVYL